MRANQPQSGPARIDPAYGADFAWNAATGVSIGPPVSKNEGQRRSVKSGIGLNSGYATVNGKIPSMFRTSWTECGVALNDGVNSIVSLSARDSGQAVVIQPSGNLIDLVMWGVADVVINGVLPLGIFHYAVRRAGSTHTVWINGKLFGVVNDSNTPVGDIGLLPSIGAQSGSGLNQAGSSLTSTNSVLGVFRTPRVLSDSQCVALSRNHWDAYEEEQEVTYASSAGGSISYTYSATGGLLLLGASNRLVSRSKLPTGGIQTSGSATKLRGIARATTGGLLFSGATNRAKGKAYTPTGGILLSGGANKLVGAVRSVLGGIVLAGTAAVQYTNGFQNKVYAAVGGMLLAGTSAIRREINKSSVGGITFGGTSGYFSGGQSIGEVWGTLNDVIYQKLRLSGKTGSRNDMVNENVYWRALYGGNTTLPLNDVKKKVLRDLGYTGTINQMEKKYWSSL